MCNVGTVPTAQRKNTNISLYYIWHRPLKYWWCSIPLPLAICLLKDPRKEPYQHQCGLFPFISQMHSPRGTALHCALISTNYSITGFQVLHPLFRVSQRAVPAEYRGAEQYGRWINDRFSSLPVQLWFSYWLWPLPNSTTCVVQVVYNVNNWHCAQ